MNSRRKFLRNSGIAASAIMVANPFELMAGGKSILSSGKNITLLHTANAADHHFLRTVWVTSSLKQSKKNTLLMNAPGSYNSSSEDFHREAGYDAVFADPATGPYQIIHKGSVKVGVISIADNGFFEDAVTKVSRYAKTLKEEKGCNLVVCMSSLGYKNDNDVDDFRLAKDSMHVDMIISSNNEKTVPLAVVLNKEGHEVIIDNAGNAEDAVGKIDISFNGAGLKNSISFN